MYALEHIGRTDNPHKVSASQLIGAAALSKTDDANVTLTLGGTIATALLQAVSLTLGWTGLLASSRGGTGNGFTKFSGPTTAEKTKTLRDANDTIIELGGSYTPTGVWTLTNCIGLPPTTGLVATITTYTPTMSSGSGTLTTTTAKSGRYYQVGKIVFVQIKGTITTNGTGATYIAFTLPSGPGNVAASSYWGTGKASAVSAKQLTVQFFAGTQNAIVWNYDGTYPGANGEVIEISGFYEVA